MTDKDTMNDVARMMMELTGKDPGKDPDRERKPGEQSVEQDTLEMKTALGCEHSKKILEVFK